MSERSNVSISEILGDNYYIDKLTSSDYSPAVGDTVSITLLVKDVFGDPVTGQTRTVTCTGGSFVSVNGSSITATSSVSVTTGSGGTVTLGLSVSVADNIIVSDGRTDCVVSSLSTSITNKVDTVYTQTLTLSSSVWTGGNDLYLYRVGKLVVAFINSKQLKYTSTGWKDMITLPEGYRPRVNTPLGVINNSSETFSQWRTNNNVVQVYCATANNSTYTGCFGVWVTNDDYPSP